MINYILENSEIYRSDRGLSGACAGGNINIIKYMIDLGNTNYGKAFKTACRYGQIDVAKYMMKYKFEDKYINQIVVEACYSGNIEMVKYVVRRNYYNWIDIMLGLAEACKYNYIDIIDYLIELGLTIDMDFHGHVK